MRVDLPSENYTRLIEIRSVSPKEYDECEYCESKPRFFLVFKDEGSYVAELMCESCLLEVVGWLRLAKIKVELKHEG